jgi:hypothetical protein
MKKSSIIVGFLIMVSVINAVNVINAVIAGEFWVTVLSLACVAFNIAAVVWFVKKMNDA